MKCFRIIFSVLLLALCSQLMNAQIPRTLSYQGVLTDSLGNPKSDGTYNLTFRLYDAETSGSVLWTEVKTLEVKRGLFTSVLGEQVNLSPTMKFDKPYWLSIQVASQPELSPRIPLSAVAYSLNSLKADTAQYAKTAPSQSFVDSARVAGTIPNNTVTNANIVDGTIQRADVVATFTAPYADTAVYARNIPQVKFTDSARIASIVPVGSIANQHLADDAVTEKKIQDGQIVRSVNQLKDNIVLTAEGGATITSNGDTIIINAGSGGGGTGVQGIQNTNNTLDVVNPNGPTVTVNVKDGGIGTTQLASNSVTSAKIANATISFADIGQNSATDGQVIKWSSGAWTAGTDNVGSSTSGWTDDGTTIRLSTSSDSVQIGSAGKLGKLNVGGNIGMSLPSSIYFGSDATRISGLVGGDLRFVAEDISMLTTEDITFGRFGVESWIKFDNANKRVGIGTLAPSDKLHVMLDDAAEGLSAVRGVATSAAGAAYGVYGQAAGSRGRGVMGEATGTSSIGVMGLATNTSSTGVWGEGANQGVYGKSDLATGKGVFGQVTSATGYSGYFDGGRFYVSGNTGIGTTAPEKKLHVVGSAQVKDTLYANVVNASKVTIMPGIANSIVNSLFNVPSSWGVLNSVTLNVPATGYVLLIASGEFQSIHDSGDNTHFYMGVSKKSDGTDIKEIAAWVVFSDRPTSIIHEVISAQAVLQVTLAGSQTFYLMGYRESGAGTDEVRRIQCNLTALYVPVAYGTVE